MTPTNDAPVTVEQRIADAIAKADAELGYSFNLTRLVDGEETHTLTMPGFEPVDFEDRDEGYALIAERRNAERAKAVLAALASAPAGDGVSLQEALKQVRQYVERKSCDAFDDREDKLLAVIDAALARPRAAVGEREV